MAKIVEIFWEDHISFSNGGGWVYHDTSVEFLQEAAPLFRTIGYLVKETEEFVIVTDTLGSGETSTLHKILKSNIVRLRTIK